MFQLNPNLRSFWKTRKSYKLLRGGRFSSKTQDAGGVAAFLARNYSIKFMCIRQFQARIKDSVYTVIKQKIEEAGWADEFDIGVSTIVHKKTGSEFLFYGMARNIEEIKGTEGVDICWIEEGEGLTEDQWSIIDPTIRKAGAEIWILWNPRYETDFVQTKLPRLLGDDCIIRHINYDENPFLSDTARKKAERLKKTDLEAYEHIYLGIPLSSDNAAVIKRQWVMAAIDAHRKLNIKPTGSKRLGFDVADDGGDKNAMLYAHGSLATWSDLWKGGEDELLKSCTKVWVKARELGADVTYDSIGVGASVGAKMNELNADKERKGKVMHAKFNAGDGVWRPDSFYGDTKVKNKDMFANLKAQAWWIVADRFKNTYNAINTGESFPDEDMIFIDPDMPELELLIDELCTPRRDFDANGRVKVESKKDMAKSSREGGARPSPNLADAFIMAFAPGHKPINTWV